MVRLIRLVVVVWVVCAGLIGIAMLGGRAAIKDNRLQSAGFDLCDGKPYFAGIMPGMTAWDTVKPHFDKYDRLTKRERAIEIYLPTSFYGNRSA
jgi:hypothetical protein